MMQVVPKWRIEWKYWGIDKIYLIYINANNSMEVTQWFNKINHGLLDIENVQYSKISDTEFKQNEMKIP